MKKILIVLLSMCISLSSLFAIENSEVNAELSKEFKNIIQKNENIIQKNENNISKNRVENDNGNEQKELSLTKEDFPKIQKGISEAIKIRIQILQEQDSCVLKSNNFEDLQKCKDKAMLNLKKEFDKMKQQS